MQKKSKKLTQKRYNEIYKSYEAAGSDAGVSKITALRKIRKEAQEIPPPQQITIIKLKNGDYPHPRIIDVDTTSARTIEGLDNQVLIATIRFPKKEVLINKLLFNEKSETIQQVLKAEALDIGLVLDERDVVIIGTVPI
jgi:hypothetical protein